MKCNRGTSTGLASEVPKNSHRNVADTTRYCQLLRQNKTCTTGSKSFSFVYETNCHDSIKRPRKQTLNRRTLISNRKPERKLSDEVQKHRRRRLYKPHSRSSYSSKRLVTKLRAITFATHTDSNPALDPQFSQTVRKRSRATSIAQERRKT